MDFASILKVPEGLLITGPKCFAFYNLIYRKTPEIGCYSHLPAEATDSRSWMIYLREFS